MADFTLNILASTQAQRFENVQSFVGEDASGYFGLQAGHIDFMTMLVFGMARFRLANEPWQYLALPSGLASFQANELTISTRYFLIDTDFDKISKLLEQRALKEQETMRSTRESLQCMELMVFKKIRELKHDTRW
ncbi:MAG: F0F1 ATP synthase subunit epsilon [Methylococcales bacterium]|nr:F0F1 ATP synthase subunit epsilon [Methylococcales bacterium]MDD5216092.1 F0F1 ATP synthase subunit epsilon [Methylococcales bacterium]